MIEAGKIKSLIPLSFQSSVLALPSLGSGKVRDWYDLSANQRLIITTDRLSAFDQVLSAVPFKGQVLNQLSAWWFEKTHTIIPNHLLSLPDPNAALVERAQPIPVEVIVRGFITGVTSTALWARYAMGERAIYGYKFSEGMRKNEKLPVPIITPTTKGGLGQHDERLTCQEVVEKGLLDARQWEKVQAAALQLFDYGQMTAGAAGMILVDTKYEFGFNPAGEICLIDEIHTPDSSRFWNADSYFKCFDQGIEPENFDKEFIRKAYVELGYKGEGQAPPLPVDVWVAASQRYIEIFERLTSSTFQPGQYPVSERLTENLRKAGIL